MNHFYHFARFFLALVLAVSAVACATAPGPLFQEVRAAAPDSGNIYVFRRDRMYGSGESWAVSLDKKPVGDLFNASFLVLDVAPGKHTVKIRPGLSTGYERELSVENGKTYFVELDANTGLLANSLFVGSAIVERTREQALPELKQLKSAR